MAHLPQFDESVLPLLRALLESDVPRDIAFQADADFLEISTMRIPKSQYESDHKLGARDATRDAQYCV